MLPQRNFYLLQQHCNDFKGLKRNYFWRVKNNCERRDGNHFIHRNKIYNPDPDSGGRILKMVQAYFGTFLQYTNNVFVQPRDC